MKRQRILDCNVLATANGMATQVDWQCEAAAIRELLDARKGLVLLDDDDAILGEYRTKANPGASQPGPADLFFRWLVNVMADRRHCRRVSAARNPDGSYRDYPPDVELSSFDPSDRVYVAVAIASGLRPDIVNATDSDWAGIAETLLRRYSTTVRQLCSAA